MEGDRMFDLLITTLPRMLSMSSLLLRGGTVVKALDPRGAEKAEPRFPKKRRPSCSSDPVIAVKATAEGKKLDGKVYVCAGFNQVERGKLYNDKR